ncbi:hypothetical protein [Shinella sp. BE166]
MVYEWDPARADRARKIKLASHVALTISVFAIPAAFILAAIAV